MKKILLTAILPLIIVTVVSASCAAQPAYFENVKGAFPAVVRVISPSEMGSGVIVTQDGYLLTSQHVVDNNKTVTVQLNNGASYQGTVLVADTDRDLAVIKLPDNPAGYTYAPMGDSTESDALQISSPVLVIGYPGGRDIHSLSLTTGTICSFIRMQSVSYLQSDAKIAAGSSGGPMTDSSGNVIGIINSKYTGMEGRCATFATAINEAKLLLNSAVLGKTAPAPAATPVPIPASDQNSCHEVGCHAPDFSLQTTEGKTLSLSSFKGKKVLLIFSSTRCPTCLQVTLCTQQFYENWPRDQLEIIFIVSQEKTAEVAGWIKTYGYKNPVVIDPDRAVYDKYRPDKVPALYFLNSDGIIKIKKFGEIDDCATQLDSLLKMY